MKKRYIFIVLGAVGIICLMAWFSVLTTIVQNLLASRENKDPVAVDLTLCDEDAIGLCVVTFGADNQNLMVIHFQLPDEDYAKFYVKATNRGTTNVYSCETAESTPTIVYCSGVRTPLGETIDIEVYTTYGDILIARGTFLVSAIALATPISLPTKEPIQEAPIATEAPTVVPTPVPTLVEVPIPLPDVESTPDTGYPNQ
jgi:hypothetical protein